MTQVAVSAKALQELESEEATEVARCYDDPYRFVVTMYPPPYASRAFNSEAIVEISACSSAEMRFMPNTPPDAAAMLSQCVTRSSAVSPVCAGDGEASIARMRRVACVNTCASGRLASHADS